MNDISAPDRRALLAYALTLTTALALLAARLVTA